MSGETKTPVLRFPDALPWARKRFGDFGTLRRGLTYSPVDCRARGVRVLRSSNIDEDVFALHEDDVFVCKQAANIPFAKNGDILITSANGSSHLVGKHAIVRGLDEQSAVHGGFMLLAESDTPDFLNAAMGAPWYKDFVASNMLGGNGALGNLSKPVFEKCFFFAPSSPYEQQSIGGFFRELDALIAEREKALGKLESLKKAMLEKMFPQGDAKVPEVRFKGFEGEWESKILAEVADVIGGGTPSTSNPEFWDGGINWFSPTEIGDSPFVGNSKRTITKAGLNNSSAVVLPPDKTILFTSRATIGEMAILNKPAATNQGFQSFVVHDGTDVYFLFSCKPQIVPWAVQHAHGSTFLEISKTALEKTPLLIPSLPEQQAIGSFFRSLDALLAARREEAEKLKQLKKAFLERMFA